MSPTRPFVKPSQRLLRQSSSQELVKFLSQMASVVSEPPLDNPRLGKALQRLATQLERNGGKYEPVPTIVKAGEGRKRQASRALPPSELATFDEAEILAFLRDPNKTKDELLELAAQRFGMARSQLKKERLEQVRLTIAAAMRHESSIEILGIEAAKGGAARRS